MIFWATWHPLTFTLIWPWKTSKAWPKLIWGSSGIAHKKNLSRVRYFRQHYFLHLFGLNFSKAWLKLIWYSSGIAHKKIWDTYDILSNRTPINFYTYLALKSLQILTETNLRLIRHNPQKKFKTCTIFWAIWHPLTFTLIWPWNPSKAWPKLIEAHQA